MFPTLQITYAEWRMTGQLAAKSRMRRLGDVGLENSTYLGSQSPREADIYERIKTNSVFLVPLIMWQQKEQTKETQPKPDNNNFLLL